MKSPKPKQSALRLTEELEKRFKNELNQADYTSTAQAAKNTFWGRMGDTVVDIPNPKGVDATLIVIAASTEQLHLLNVGENRAYLIGYGSSHAARESSRMYIRYNNRSQKANIA